MTQNIKIFIAEDEPILNDIYSQRFVNSGFTVKSFFNGEDLISGISDETPDIILLDLNMPKMDGFSVLETIHQNFQDKNKQNVLVIAWSNSHNDSEIQKSLLSGANVFLHKGDYEGQDLVEKVRTIYLERPHRI